jgi:hypothetical protein
VTEMSKDKVVVLFKESLKRPSSTLRLSFRGLIVEARLP